MLNEKNLNNILTVASLLIITIPVGIACIILGYGFGDNPCILCWEERIAMILAALTILFITRYGLRFRYIGTLILISVYGVWAGFRHSSRHILRDMGQGFGPSIFGIHTYVWVIVIFILILLSGSIMLLLIDSQEYKVWGASSWNGLNKATTFIFLIITAFNIVQAFTQVGPFPYIGQGDPYRMTLNLKQTKWSMEHWPSISSFSLGEELNISRPDFSLGNAKKNSEIKSSSLVMLKSIKLPKEIHGIATGISYNPEKNIFAITTSDNGVYILNEELSKIVAFVKIDSGFSVDLSNIAGVAFDGANSLLVVTDHKSYSELRIDKKAKLNDGFWLFTSGVDGFSELARDRFSTIRSKYNYIGDIAWDAKNKEYVAISIPNKGDDAINIIRIDGRDFELNSDKKINGIDNVITPYITGVAIGDDKAYLLDHNTCQILFVNLSNNSITEEEYIPRVNNPQGVAIKDNNLLVLDAKKAKNMIYVYSLK